MECSVHLTFGSWSPDNVWCRLSQRHLIRWVSSSLAGTLSTWAPRWTRFHSLSFWSSLPPGLPLLRLRKTGPEWWELPPGKHFPSSARQQSPWYRRPLSSSWSWKCLKFGTGIDLGHLGDEAGPGTVKWLIKCLDYLALKSPHLTTGNTSSETM